MEIRKQLTSSRLGTFPRKGDAGNWMTPPFLTVTSLLHTWRWLPKTLWLCGSPASLSGKVLKQDLTKSFDNVYIILLSPTWSLIDFHQSWSSCWYVEEIVPPWRILNNNYSYVNKSLFGGQYNCETWHKRTIYKLLSILLHPEPSIKCSLLPLHYKGPPIHLQVDNFKTRAGRTACCTHWAFYYFPLQKGWWRKKRQPRSSWFHNTQSAFRKHTRRQVAGFQLKAVCKFYRHLLLKMSRLGRLHCC